MPTLPTFTVTDTVANRLMAAFDGWTDENGNALTPQQAYKRWLRNSLVSHVRQYEANANKAALESELT